MLHNDAFLYLSGDKIAVERKNLSDEDEYKMFCKEMNHFWSRYSIQSSLMRKGRCLVTTVVRDTTSLSELPKHLIRRIRPVSVFTTRNDKKVYDFVIDPDNPKKNAFLASQLKMLFYPELDMDDETFYRFFDQFMNEYHFKWKASAQVLMTSGLIFVMPDVYHFCLEIMIP